MGAAAPDTDTMDDAMKMCKDFRLLLKLWDDIFSDMYKVDPTDVFCDASRSRLITPWPTTFQWN